MVEKYSMPFRVSSYDVDPTRRLRLSVILKLLQEVAGRHFDSGGLTYEVLKEHGMVYLVTREAVGISRMPAYGEELTVETWFKETKGAQYIRKARILAGAEVLIEIDTAWVLADAKSHRILRPSAFPWQVPAHNAEVGIAVNKLELPEQMPEVGSREIRWSDIDCNGHMNNAVYADIVCDFLPGGASGKTVREFRIAFLNEALQGDTLSVRSAQTDDGQALYAGYHGDRVCFEAKIGFS